MDKCSNCGTEITDLYCPHCGQEKITHRLEVKFLVKQFASGFFHWDSTFIYTFKRMILQPGKAAREYIEGIRKKYIKPLTYYIFIITVVFIGYHYMMLWFGDRSPGSGFELQTNEEYEHFMHYAVFLLPLIFTWVYFLFNRKRTGINFAESLVFSFYYNGTLMVLTFINNLFKYVNIWVFFAVGFIVFIYSLYAIMQFGEYKKFKGFLISLIIYLLSTAITTGIIYGIILIANEYIFHIKI